MSDPDPLMAKGTAILLANRAKSAGDLEEARKHFVRAAELEELVFREFASRGRRDFLVNAISAVSCWIEAKHYEKALRAEREALALAAAKDVDRDLLTELSRLTEGAEIVATEAALLIAREEADSRIISRQDDRDRVAELNAKAYELKVRRAEAVREPTFSQRRQEAQ